MAHSGVELATFTLSKVQFEQCKVVHLCIIYLPIQLASLCIQRCFHVYLNGYINLHCCHCLPFHNGFGEDVPPPPPQLLEMAKLHKRCTALLSNFDKCDNLIYVM